MDSSRQSGDPQNTTPVSTPTSATYTDHPHADQTPQRLSALYQYHNAPEVAPAHGLEYDDTIYPVSDKYPVTREALHDGRYGGKPGYSNESRPPRIIFGMKVRTFLLVALVMILVIIGAAVGGAVGGEGLRSGSTQDGTVEGSTPNTPSTSATPSATSASPSSTTFTAATPTFSPLSDCPASNNTAFLSSYAQGSSGSVPAGAGLDFTKYCDLTNPLSVSSASKIAEAFVYTFSDCVEVCAGYNFWNAGSNCTVAVYLVAGGRPGNCWIGNAEGTNASALSSLPGTAVALLNGT